jgi:hypothetical protein
MFQYLVCVGEGVSFLSGKAVVSYGRVPTVPVPYVQKTLEGGGALTGTETAADFSWVPFVIFISLISGKRVATVGSPELVFPAGRAKRLIVEPDDETRLTCLIFPPQLAARPPFQVPGTALKISVANLDLLFRGMDPDPDPCII